MGSDGSIEHPVMQPPNGSDTEPSAQLPDSATFAFKWLSADRGTRRACWSRPTTIPV